MLEYPRIFTSSSLTPVPTETFAFHEKDVNGAFSLSLRVGNAVKILGSIWEFSINTNKQRPRFLLFATVQ